MKLPTKLHRLITLALSDLRKTMRQPKKYFISMSDWHHPTRALGCEVCLAGSVMAQSLGSRAENTVFPEDFSPAISAKLHAIDYLRVGEVDYAYRCLHIARPSPNNLPRDRSITPFCYDQDEFFSDMQQLAAELRKVNL